MVDISIETEYVNSLYNEYTDLNADAYTFYKNAFANWMIQQIGNPPTPPQLVVFNQATALQLVINWSNTMTGTLPVPGAASPVCDLSSAITYVTAAALTVPPPVVAPPPIDPVGPATGAFDAYGRPTFYNVTGETPAQYPNGFNFTDIRGTFIHEVSATPFGMESQWALVVPATATS